MAQAGFRRCAGWVWLCGGGVWRAGGSWDGVVGGGRGWLGVGSAGPLGRSGWGASSGRACQKAQPSVEDNGL